MKIFERPFRVRLEFSQGANRLLFSFFLRSLRSFAAIQNLGLCVFA
jgi:hypothetical protein